MKFFSLASGSTGNSFLIDNGEDLILIDVGLTYNKIKEKKHLFDAIFIYFKFFTIIKYSLT